MGRIHVLDGLRREQNSTTAHPVRGVHHHVANPPVSIVEVEITDPSDPAVRGLDSAAQHLFGTARPVDGAKRLHHRPPTPPRYQRSMRGG